MITTLNLGSARLLINTGDHSVTVTLFHGNVPESAKTLQGSLVTVDIQPAPHLAATVMGVVTQEDRLLHVHVLLYDHETGRDHTVVFTTVLPSEVRCDGVSQLRLNLDTSAVDIEIQQPDRPPFTHTFPLKTP